jgi:signal transduction histidine kinase
MNVISRLRRFRPPIGYVLVVLVVVVTLLALLTSTSLRLTSIDIVVLLATSAAYAILGTGAYARLERAGSLSVSLIFFAVQIALAAAAMIVGGAPGLVGLMLLPLAAQAAVILPRGWMLIVCAGILAANAISVGVITGWQNAAPSTLTYLAGVVFAVGITQVAIREERARLEVERLASELRAANDKLRAYAAQAEELATTQERNRLAREIHDGLGHYLTAISMQLQAARAVWSNNPARSADALGKAQTLTREALADVRRSVAALRASPTEDRPLPEALAPLVDESRAAGIRTELVVNGAARDLSPQARLALYRAAQEGLTNVHKHARASRVDLVLDYGDASSVRLTVRDDGVGAQHINGGFGLIGLRERVQYLGGALRTHTAEGRGFALEVKVPG